MPKFVTSLFIETPPDSGEYAPLLLEVGQIIRDGSVFYFLSTYLKEFVSDHKNAINDTYNLPIDPSSPGAFIRAVNYRRFSNFTATLKIRMDPLEVALSEVGGREELVAPKPPVAMFITSDENYDESFFNYNRTLSSFYMSFYKFKGFLTEAVEYRNTILDGIDISLATFQDYFDAYYDRFLKYTEKANDIEQDYGSRLANLFYLSTRSPVFSSAAFLVFPSIKNCSEGVVTLKLVPQSFSARIDFVMPSKLSTIYYSTETLKNRLFTLFSNPVVEIPTIRYPLVWSSQDGLALWFEADIPVFYVLNSLTDVTSWEAEIPPNVSVVSLSLNGYYMRPVFDRVIRSGEGLFLDPLFLDKMTKQRGPKEVRGLYVEKAIIRLNVTGG